MDGLAEAGADAEVGFAVMSSPDDEISAGEAVTTDVGPALGPALVPLLRYSGIPKSS
jgi:hypothetical protein